MTSQTNPLSSLAGTPSARFTMQPSSLTEISLHSPSYLYTRWLETAVYPRPMYGLRHAPCTGPARGLTHRRPPAPSSCCTGPATRLTPSPAASCLFTLHRPDFRRLPYTRRVGSLPSGFFLPVHADSPSIYIPAQPRRGSSQTPIYVYCMKYIYISS